MNYLGWLLITLGVPFALANWYSLISQSISGRHSSMVPPLGGLLIGAGAWLVSGTVWWSLVGIPADIGLLGLILALPYGFRTLLSESRSRLVGEYHAWRDGHRTILKLYKPSRAKFVYTKGEGQYCLTGTWKAVEDGYQVTDYLFGRACRLSWQDDNLVATETVPDADLGDAAVDLDGLIFQPITAK